MPRKLNVRITKPISPDHSAQSLIIKNRVNASHANSDAALAAALTGAVANAAGSQELIDAAADAGIRAAAGGNNLEAARNAANAAAAVASAFGGNGDAIILAATRAAHVAFNNGAAHGDDMNTVVDEVHGNLTAGHYYQRNEVITVRALMDRGLSFNDGLADNGFLPLINSQYGTVNGAAEATLDEQAITINEVTARGDRILKAKFGDEYRSTLVDVNGAFLNSTEAKRYQVYAFAVGYAVKFGKPKTHKEFNSIVDSVIDDINEKAFSDAAEAARAKYPAVQGESQNNRDNRTLMLQNLSKVSASKAPAGLKFKYASEMKTFVQQGDVNLKDAKKLDKLADDLKTYQPKTYRFLKFLAGAIVAGVIIGLILTGAGVPVAAGLLIALHALSTSAAIGGMSGAAVGVGAIAYSQNQRQTKQELGMESKAGWTGLGTMESTKTHLTSIKGTAPAIIKPGDYEHDDDDEVFNPKQPPNL